MADGVFELGANEEHQYNLQLERAVRRTLTEDDAAPMLKLHRKWENRRDMTPFPGHKKDKTLTAERLALTCMIAIGHAELQDQWPTAKTVLRELGFPHLSYEEIDYTDNVAEVGRMVRSALDHSIDPLAQDEIPKLFEGLCQEEETTGDESLPQ